MTVQHIKAGNQALGPRCHLFKSSEDFLWKHETCFWFNFLSCTYLITLQKGLRVMYLMYTPRDTLEFPIYLTCMFLDCGREHYMCVVNLFYVFKCQDFGSCLVLKIHRVQVGVILWSVSILRTTTLQSSMFSIQLFNITSFLHLPYVIFALTR